MQEALSQRLIHYIDLAMRGVVGVAIAGWRVLGLSLGLMLGAG